MVLLLLLVHQVLSHLEVAVHGVGRDWAARLACRFLTIFMRQSSLLSRAQWLLVLSVVLLMMLLVQIRGLFAVPVHVLEAPVMTVAALNHRCGFIFLVSCWTSLMHRIQTAVTWRVLTRCADPRLLLHLIIAPMVIISAKSYGS